MKQFTNAEQTDKLIELGFEKPSMAAPKLKWADGEPVFEPQYTIGELIEMLPKADRAGERSVVYDGLEWVIDWDNDDGTINQVVATELIDALYDMVVKLKDEGVI